MGGHAVMKYTEPRSTRDLDVWVGSSPENSARIFQALAAFGAPLKRDGVAPEMLAKEEIVYQIGVAPVRVGVMTHISRVQFRDGWENRVRSSRFGVPVHFLSLADLIANKQAAGRAEDLDHLKRIHAQGKKAA